MHLVIEFLPPRAKPRAKLVDEVVDWLCGREPFEAWRGFAGCIRTDPSDESSILSLRDAEALGPCQVPVRLDRPSSPANPWDLHEMQD